jgi:hypothetical protein
MKKLIGSVMCVMVLLMVSSFVWSGGQQEKAVSAEAPTVKFPMRAYSL